MNKPEDVALLMAAAEEATRGMAPIEELAEEERHTLLEVWSSVLDNIEHDAAEKITMRVAATVVSRWPTIKIQDVGAYMEYYYNALKNLREILRDEIATDKKAIYRVDMENDAEGNRHHYLSLLTNWQLQVAQWEKDWSHSDSDALLQMAAFSDAASFVLGQEGLIAHLQEINFQFYPEDAEAVQAAVIAL